MKIILPQGTGVIKKTKSFKKLTDTQKMIYKKVYDPIKISFLF